MLTEDYGYTGVKMKDSPNVALLRRTGLGEGAYVMVCGGIMGNRKHSPVVTLKQDNARPHVARVTTQFLQQNNVNVMPWPAVSPYLNPIEHMREQLGRKARANHQIDNVRDPTRALQQEWRNLSNALVLRYVTSMRRRIIACIRANGGHTQY